MEHVAAREPPDDDAVLKRALTNHALVVAAVDGVGVAVGGTAAEVELVEEDDEGGEARADGREEAVVVGGSDGEDRGRVGFGDSEEGVEESEEEGAKVGERIGEESYEEKRN